MSKTKQPFKSGAFNRKWTICSHICPTIRSKDKLNNRKELKRFTVDSVKSS